MYFHVFCILQVPLMISENTPAIVSLPEAPCFHQPIGFTSSGRTLEQQALRLFYIWTTDSYISSTLVYYTKGCWDFESMISRLSPSGGYGQHCTASCDHFQASCSILSMFHTHFSAPSGQLLLCSQFSVTTCTGVNDLIYDFSLEPIRD